MNDDRQGGRKEIGGGGEQMVMVNARKVEVLKVFYALFTTLMDSQHHEPQMSDAELLDKLRKLNAKLKNVAQDYGTLN